MIYTHSADLVLVVLRAVIEAHFGILLGFQLGQLFLSVFLLNAEYNIHE